MTYTNKKFDPKISTIYSNHNIIQNSTKINSIQRGENRKNINKTTTRLLSKTTKKIMSKQLKSHPKITAKAPQPTDLSLLFQPSKRHQVPKQYQTTLK